jgi:hypothetical protein
MESILKLYDEFFDFLNINGYSTPEEIHVTDKSFNTLATEYDEACRYPERSKKLPNVLVLHHPYGQTLVRKVSCGQD